MRLFIAIDVGELKEYLAHLQDQLPKNFKLSLARSFHLTLKFLGEVKPDMVDQIVEELGKIKFEAFSVHIDSIGLFPTENYIRVVWVCMKPEENIIHLQNNIDEILKPLFKKEKDFKEHITLARMKYPEDKKSFVEHVKKMEIEPKKAEIRNFKLKKSTLSSKGAVYEDIAVFNSA